VAPGESVPGHVYFGYHTDTSVEGRCNDLRNFVGGVDGLRVPGASLGEQGVGRDLEGEGLGVDEMPVENVELVVGHGVEELHDHVNGEVVSGAVDEDPAPRKSRRVTNGGSWYEVLGAVEVDQLGEGLEASECSESIGGREGGNGPRDHEGVAFVCVNRQVAGLAGNRDTEGGENTVLGRRTKKLAVTENELVVSSEGTVEDGVVSCRLGEAKVRTHLDGTVGREALWLRPNSSASNTGTKGQ
jgi:hypothetical protein